MSNAVFAAAAAVVNVSKCNLDWDEIEMMRRLVQARATFVYLNTSQGAPVGVQRGAVLFQNLEWGCRKDRHGAS